MSTHPSRPGDPELAMIEALEASIANSGHTFDDFDEDLGARIQQHRFGDLTWTFEGSCRIQIRPEGRAEVRKFRARQADLPARKRALPDLYLRYVWERSNAGADAYPSEFLATNPNWCGDVYTAQELECSGKLLYERGFIEGVMMNNSDAPVRVSITRAGEDTVEAGRSVHAA